MEAGMKLFESASDRISATARHRTGRVGGIRIVDHPTGMLVLTLCAKIDLDVDFKAETVRFDTFQEQLAATNFAVHGW
jgi:hypothetical protein